MEPMRGCQTQEQDRAIPEGARGTIVRTSAKDDPSPSSVKNVNLRPQANPGHRKRVGHAPRSGTNQAGELRKGDGSLGRLVKPFTVFEPIK